MCIVHKFDTDFLWNMRIHLSEHSRSNLFQKTSYIYLGNIKFPGSAGLDSCKTGETRVIL